MTTLEELKQRIDDLSASLRNPKRGAMPRVPGRRFRTTSREIVELKARILLFAKKTPVPFAISDVVQSTGLQRKQTVRRVLFLLTQDGLLRLSGDRRCARYQFVATRQSLTVTTRTSQMKQSELSHFGAINGVSPVANSGLTIPTVPPEAGLQSSVLPNLTPELHNYYMSLGRSKRFMVEVFVLPETAAAMLMTPHPKQRPMSNPFMTAWVELMQSRRWELTHQGIAFCKLGYLNDGHHRCTAAVKGQTGFPCQVTYGEEEATPTDRGRSRSACHSRQMSGGVGDTSPRYFAAFRVIWCIDRDSWATHHFAVEHLETLERQYPICITWLLENRKETRPAPLYGACAYASLVNYTFATEFVTKVTTGIGLTKDSPELAYHNYLNTKRGVSTNGDFDRKDMTMKTLTTIRKAMLGQPTKAVYSRKDDYDWFRAQVAKGTKK